MSRDESNLIKTKGDDMKVLIISRGLPDEKYPLNGIFEFDQAKALAENGVRVVFFGVDIRSIRRIRKWGITYEERENVQCYTINFPVGAMPLCIRKYIAEKCLNILFKYVFSKQSKPDIIHAHFTFQGYISYDLAKSFHIPLIITEHSSEINKSFIDFKIRKIAKEAYGKADKIVAVSSSLADKIKKNFDVDCVVIPNIVDITKFTIGKESSKLLRFISVGSLKEIKNPLGLLDAFAEIHKEYPKMLLEFVGDGDLLTELKNRVTLMGLQGSVLIDGSCSREEISKKLQNADAFILLSKGETFGVAYIEAMACGLPVIATTCGGPEDFVSSTNGILVSPGSIDQAVNAMRTMIKEYKNYDHQLIRSIVVKYFSSNEVATKIERLYKEVKEKANSLEL